MEKHKNWLVQVTEVPANNRPVDDSLISPRPKTVADTFDNDLMCFFGVRKGSEHE